MTLDSEVKRRLPENSLFDEPELWYILEGIVELCTHFENEDIYHGDINPK